MGKLGEKIKFSMKISPDANEDELSFVKQLGINYVYTWVKDDQISYDFLAKLREKVEAAGLVLYNAGNMSLEKCDKIHLNLPGRDEKIAELQEFIRNLGEAGIHITTFTWEPSGVWSSERGENRGASARHVNLVEMKERPFTHGKVYTEEEIWNNYQYFISQILPVAEEAEVKLSLHPNDPPYPILGGIPSLIHSFASYKRAFSIADSSYLGMEFCTGCWLEGGKDFGDILEGIQYFGERKKINIVHFRNVNQPQPVFTETFLDNGYMDMYQVMKALCEVDYDGSLILDHTPQFVIGGTDSALAYGTGYMRALWERALTEVNF